MLLDLDPLQVANHSYSESTMEDVVTLKDEDDASETKCHREEMLQAVDFMRCNKLSPEDTEMALDKGKDFI